MSVVHEYLPFQKPECTTTHEQMQEKLASRVQQVVAKAVDAGVEEATQALLHWKRGEDEWTLLSKCDHYKIRKKCIEGAGKHSGAQFNYESFHIVPGAWDFSIGLSSDSKRARALCEEHENMLVSLRKRA